MRSWTFFAAPVGILCRRRLRPAWLDLLLGAPNMDDG